MLIRFSIENWMSFRDKVTFSAIASRERQHNERIPHLKKYGARVLPISAIFGGNASGKTSFFMALNFVRRMIVNGLLPDRNIPVIPFSLDKSYANKPSSFNLEILVDDTIYEFSFTTTRKKIMSEKLVQITSRGENLIYLRETGKKQFDSDLKKYLNDTTLNVFFKGTRDNQLFLTNTVNQQIAEFRHIYDWFAKDLILIAPDSRFNNFELITNKADKLNASLIELLPLLDTGIIELDSEEVPIDNLSLPAEIKMDLEEEVDDDSTVLVSSLNLRDERYLVSRKNEKLIAKKLITYHLDSEGNKIKFELFQESDGSKRVLDLLPAFIKLMRKNSKKVFIIDELDRSLHTKLSRTLLELYLANTSNETRTQLLFTTHDALLMDQQLFRRDELWVTERENRTGHSMLYSFSEFKDVRYDKDIRKSYLTGRLGGIPRILINMSCSRGK